MPPLPKALRAGKRVLAEKEGEGRAAQHQEVVVVDEGSKQGKVKPINSFFNSGLSSPKPAKTEREPANLLRTQRQTTDDRKSDIEMKDVADKSPSEGTKDLVYQPKGYISTESLKRGIIDSSDDEDGSDEFQDREHEACPAEKILVECKESIDRSPSPSSPQELESSESHDTYDQATTVASPPGTCEDAAAPRTPTKETKGKPAEFCANSAECSPVHGGTRQKRGLQDDHCKILAQVVAKACLENKSKGWILATFNDQAPGYPKSAVQLHLLKMCKYEKRAEKTRWWLQEEALELVNDDTRQKLKDLELMPSTPIKVKPVLTVAPVTPQVVTESDDPRIATYREYYDKIAIKAKSLLNEECELDGKAMSNLESLQDLSSTPATECIARMLQGKQLTIDGAVDFLMKEAPASGLSRDALKEKILLFIERKAYGPKPRGAISHIDTSSEALWRLEAFNTSLFPPVVAKALITNRRKLNVLTKRLNATHRVLSTLRKNVGGKYETKAAKEIEQVLKYMREDELQRQKAEEAARRIEEKKRAAEEKRLEQEAKELEKIQEKEKKRKSPPATPLTVPKAARLTSFFQKVDKPTQGSSIAPPKSSGTLIGSGTSGGSLNSFLVSKACASQTERETALKETAARIDAALGRDPIEDLQAYAAKLRKTCRPIRKYAQGKASVKKVQEDVFASVTRSLNEEDDSSADAVEAQKSRKKLLHFHGTNRPPYFGTFRRASDQVGPRTFHKMDASIDYEVDSDDEWQDEPDDAESLADSESEEGDADEKELDYQDGWLLQDDEVVFESGVSDGGMDSDEEDTDQTKQRRSSDGKTKTKRMQMLSCAGLTDRYQVGVLYDEQRIRDGQLGETAKNLLRYEIQALPNNADFSETDLVIKPACAKEIAVELLSTKKRQAALGVANNTSTDSKDDKEAASSKFPKDQLQDLVRLAEGSFLGKSKLVDLIYEDQRQRFALEFSSKSCSTGKVRNPAAKAHILGMLKAVAVREKRAGDSKPRWYVHEQVLKDSNIERATSVCSEGTPPSPSIAPKKAPVALPSKALVGGTPTKPQSILKQTKTPETPLSAKRELSSEVSP
eukprot:CAMPEP_0184547142 /NCGR_PEP_ID=MMETSP0199_2-20130426/5387_1 /TAXON_ID=1112570 /ORGANISM="Thraustochytrium sp., Strain LLF1b" /LENGTH=1080 /DNA_ID=CAMNT_0026941605 /DNA_START=283 /DNA_END=3522 /DNA_ORIENTATION=-